MERKIEIEQFITKLVKTWKNPTGTNATWVEFFSGRIMLYAAADMLKLNAEKLYEITEENWENWSAEDIVKLLMGK